MATLVPASAVEACASCFHFARTPHAGNIGFCRRRAPVLMPASGTAAVWPSVATTDRCGEYEILYVPAPRPSPGDAAFAEA
jgi:hypothetical protein